jgi:hypothetical protein
VGCGQQKKRSGEQADRNKNIEQRIWVLSIKTAKLDNEDFCRYYKIYYFLFSIPIHFDVDNRYM